MEEENRSILKKYRDMQEEVEDLRDRLQRHNKGDVTALRNLTYAKAVDKLMSLRRKMVRCPKHIRRIL